MVKFNKRLLIVWVVLASLTLAYLWIDRADRANTASAAVTSAVIVIAVIKVRIIFREFMEVRQAPVLLCRLTDAWVVLIAASMLACYFIGMQVG
ncbi:cytochrome C oxidase subunit IV family protein [Mycobacterium sp. 663a-19]|uniref:cytochrome C oxidase subunit IV family protein n=1 Tax=Mycobacterium sp. 663a-19 TaxID=2986148 RepID=UPI002D1F0467|nr:cytochrome C oxidase subunit IV family protein [Mycobacterium sp. 663a-19]MEB3979941.1 cytochrome C oxidase subunit IV family protein [Mycobacterium sp. 663a-19]